MTVWLIIEQKVNVAVRSLCFRQSVQLSHFYKEKAAMWEFNHLTVNQLTNHFTQLFNTDRSNVVQVKRYASMCLTHLPDYSNFLWAQGKINTWTHSKTLCTPREAVTFIQAFVNAVEGLWRGQKTNFSRIQCTDTGKMLKTTRRICRENTIEQINHPLTPA